MRRAASVVGAVAVATLPGCGAPDQRTSGSYDPRAPVVACLGDKGISARAVGGTAIVADGVRIDFLRTPGEAIARQIAGQAQGAEQIGRALVWVDSAPDALLAPIERCVDR
jgi:hypothetical protein